MESSLKLLDYISKVAAEPIRINDEPTYDATVAVTISETFYGNDACRMCGRCCMNETTVWSPVDWEENVLTATEEDFKKWNLSFEDKQKVIDESIKHPLKINDLDTYFMVHPRDKGEQITTLSWPDRKPRDTCHFMFQDGDWWRCKIHPIKSITCGIPHMRFFHNKKSQKTSIGISQYGRNWAMKCPEVLNTRLATEEELSGRIYWLERLNEAAKCFNVKTFLPQVLEYLHAGHRKPITFINKDNRITLIK